MQAEVVGLSSRFVTAIEADMRAINEAIQLAAAAALEACPDSDAITWLYSEFDQSDCQALKEAA